MSRCQHGYLWQSLSIRPYRSSFSGGPLCSILYPKQSWSMYVFAGRPTLACPCASFHRRTSLMSLSLLLQQCPVCLVRLTRMVWVICGWWPYSCFLVECCSGTPAAFLCSSHLVYSLVASLGSRWCSHTAVLTRQRPGRTVSLTCLRDWTLQNEWYNW